MHPQCWICQEKRFHERFFHEHSSSHSLEERDEEKDPLLPSCRVLEGKEQLRHPDSTNPSEKLPLERFFPSAGLYFLLPPCSLHPVQSWWCRMEQGGWNRGTMQSLISSPVSLIYYCMRGSFRTKLPVREIIP